MTLIWLASQGCRLHREFIPMKAPIEVTLSQNMRDGYRLNPAQEED
jgi:hypothetical protein